MFVFTMCLGLHRFQSPFGFSPMHAIIACCISNPDPLPNHPACCCCLLLLLVFVLKASVLQTEPLSISFSLSLAGMVHAVLVPSFGERYRIEAGPSMSAQSSPELGRYFYFSSPSCLQCHSHCHDWLVCFCCFYPAQLKAFQACISHTMASWSTP